MGFDSTDAAWTMVKKWVIVVAGFYFCAVLGLAIMSIRHVPASQTQLAAKAASR